MPENMALAAKFCDVQSARFVLSWRSELGSMVEVASLAQEPSMNQDLEHSTCEHLL